MNTTTATSSKPNLAPDLHGTGTADNSFLLSLGTLNHMSRVIGDGSPEGTHARRRRAVISETKPMASNGTTTANPFQPGKAEIAPPTSAIAMSDLMASFQEMLATLESTKNGHWPDDAHEVIERAQAVQASFQMPPANPRRGTGPKR